MRLLGDGMIAFFTAVGVTGCVWFLAGALLGLGRCASRDIRLVLSVSGEAPAMEHDLRDLLRLRRQLPYGAAVVLKDCGLTEEARKTAEYFCRRYDGVELETGEDAPIYERGMIHGRTGDPGGYGT